MSRGVVTASVSAQDTFTSWMQAQGQFNISVSGTWAGTVTLQRRFGTSGSALDVEAYTANTEKQAVEAEDDVYYRAGVKTGEYTSGTAELRISQ